MSFIDGIFNGITGAVRGVLGIDDEPAKQSSAEPGRSRDLARDSRTGYDGARDDRPAADTSAAPHEGSTLATLLAARAGRGAESQAEARSSFSLLGQLRANIDGRSTTADPGQPSAGAYAPEAQQPAHQPAATDGPRRARTQGVATAARATVFDAGSGATYGTVDSLTGSSDAAVAARNVQSGIDYMASTFGRDGVDGAGSGVSVLIDDRSADEHGNERFRGNGGYYAMPDGAGGLREAIHFGTGTSYAAAHGQVDQRSMLHADDLAIHELVHGVIRKETGHLGGGADESGATNEAIADVIAAAATRDWTIGEGMYTERSDYRMMRNIADPDDARAVHGLWTSMDQVQQRRAAGEEVEEHWASGVISTAAHRVQQRVGGEAGWSVVEQVFYDAIDNQRLGDMSFQAVAGALRTSASALYGQASVEHQVVDEELRRAGL